MFLYHNTSVLSLLILHACLQVQGKNEPLMTNPVNLRDHVNLFIWACKQKNQTYGFLLPIWISKLASSHELCSSWLETESLLGREIGREEGNSNESYQGNLQHWDCVIQLECFYIGKQTSWHLFLFLENLCVAAIFCVILRFTHQLVSVVIYLSEKAYHYRAILNFVDI